ncbi:unnamed protein product [Phytophthora fragariaefolia]|uniref:Unnamed protein product n=1 Tax=Phytophthora fragariaefolia TaxID=1490495 RepID=A0A9W6TXE4_9STRA|nr:unnamed protein product [Phytophthora fragariaefolia]
MYASIQKRQEVCDTSILAAAKKLQDQTQHALLKDLAMAKSEPIEEQIDANSYSTDSNSASFPEARSLQNVRPVRHRPLSSPRCVMPTINQASPVSRQRAKLQALEEKLAAFSPESLTRVKNELATPTRQRFDRSAAVANKRASGPKYKYSSDRVNSPKGTIAHDAGEWQPSPFSPLRKGPSCWKNGISREARYEDFQAGAGRPKNSSGSAEASKRAAKLSRRFLRPEEEEELRHLRASIGLAKDWMASNS